MTGGIATGGGTGDDCGLCTGDGVRGGVLVGSGGVMGAGGDETGDGCELSTGEGEGGVGDGGGVRTTGDGGGVGERGGDGGGLAGRVGVRGGVGGGLISSGGVGGGVAGGVSSSAVLVLVKGSLRGIALQALLNNPGSVDVDVDSSTGADSLRQ